VERSTGQRKEEFLKAESGQPFHLQLIGSLLRLCGDPDWEVFYKGEMVGGQVHSFADGVPIGYKCDMPRKPEVFEAKEKWKKYEESEFQPDMANYSSVTAAVKDLLSQFKEEEGMGLMVEVDEAEYRKTCPPWKIVGGSSGGHRQGRRHMASGSRWDPRGSGEP
jgi:hypothetical protein